ncbi:aldo/keto reductase [Streptomyces sp. NPDC007205]|uniref:aldo/keto reductase n=1 Tax=Streptomyces sp. NPDC007205 TaxID=3154316 RepID=UPI0033E4D031
MQGELLAYESALSRTPHMPYRRCGYSGLHVSAISLCVPLSASNRRQPGLRKTLAQRAFDRGISHFDLPASWMARRSVSSRRMNDALAGLRRQRDEIVLAAHVGFGTRQGQSFGFGSRKQLMSSLDSVLRGLSLEYVDILYSDRYDPSTPLEETMGALVSAVNQGKAFYIGLAGYAPTMARRAIEILYELGSSPIVCQGSFSVLNRWAEEALLDVLDFYRVSFVADNPLANGLLDTKTFRNVNSHRDQLMWPMRDHTDLDLLKTVASARGQTLAQLALSWVLRDRRVSSAIITPESPAQLDELCAAAEQTSFTEAELEVITASIGDGR